MSSGLEKPLATGTNSTCSVGGGGGGGGVVIEPPLHPKPASATHKTRTALRRNLEERLSCMIPPQLDFSILPKGETLRRVILRYDLSTILVGRLEKAFCGKIESSESLFMAHRT